MSKRLTSAVASVIASAASAGHRSWRAQTRASAASTSSIAASHERSSTAFAAPPRANMAPNSPSEGKEDGFLGSLKVDVETVATLGRLGNEGRPPIGGHGLENRVGG